MGRRPLPTAVLALRGAFIAHPERKPRAPPAEVAASLPADSPPEKAARGAPNAAVVDLANERIGTIEPPPPTLQDARAAKLWTDCLAKMVAAGTATPDLLRVLERLCLLQTALWRGCESGKLPTASLSKEIGTLELRLGLAAKDARGEALTPIERNSSLWRLKQRALAHETADGAIPMDRAPAPKRRKPLKPRKRREPRGLPEPRDEDDAR